MSVLRVVLGDQLSRSISSLQDIDTKRDIVLMMEVAGETTYVPHHQQKIVLILSAMRHFADELREEGIGVDYVRLDDRENTGSFTGELRRALQRHAVERVVATEPGEWRVLEMMHAWKDQIGTPIEIRGDARFLCTREEFTDWAKDRKTLRMEHFYREMRRRTGWLMHEDQPEGGDWNYDAQNRKPLPGDVSVPACPGFAPDPITREVMELIRERFSDHIGELDNFYWGVTRRDALYAMTQFIEHALPRFGDYQDAMKRNEDFLYHSVLSPYLNTGLLLPREVCEAAIDAYENDHAPLNAVEGFIRQILGWREYMRGIYWLRMPGYESSNHLDAHRPLPAFYWSGDTAMRCLAEAVDSTRRHAYAHHIQRLMLTGNFALLAGIAPAEVEAWYLAVYADAYEWVELPNTHGMALFADGGLLSTKPYAASGAYIDRMSDYCSGCAYNPKIKSGGEACPFNYLYWHFLIVNEKKLVNNPRMRMPYRTLERMDADRRKEIKRDAERFLDSLGD